MSRLNCTQESAFCAADHLRSIMQGLFHTFYVFAAVGSLLPPLNQYLLTTLRMKSDRESVHERDQWAKFECAANAKISRYCKVLALRARWETLNLSKTPIDNSLSSKIIINHIISLSVPLNALDL